MRRLWALLGDLAVVGAAIAAAVLVLSIGLALSGFSPVVIFREWIRGATGAANLLASLKGACPLILTGLAAGAAFRAGVFNIGAEGQSIAGTIAMAAFATRLWPGAPSPWVAIPLALVVAALGGAVWASAAALLDRFRGVPVVLSTILLNFIALELLRLLIEGPLKARAAGKG